MTLLRIAFKIRLLLTEEKGKRMNVEEHLRLLKEQVFKGGETYDVLVYNFQ